ncbi:class I SAM-dependent methyltransferase [Aspergillus fischeri NRRL 181]|uniref:Methyltransferase type 12 domain-containing protein n=1 Tax=Neosartorya fischeri (strain ATCC 1020 / DSM 3700 / CBS 544.65 / FGSC A1164 / JCM 1740 / NRRL 181 / WB 181) TaxID=331117 RepID=A1D0Y6_NEOFI|nr:uncharacterized protein NFIA_007550 [Aspergillus fischeri NRRL 181]EAW22079.1 hypothetical protein NFIA_007550 [Aspergillus fischeri NRRL 181]KAG2001417.1 hypothetical protein GB937_010151 [Aspergillus fischeri]
MHAIENFPRVERQKLIKDTYAKILHLPGRRTYSVGIKRICEHADQIFTGEANTLDLLMQNNILASFDGSSLPPYSVYTFTDISAGFFTQAKEWFTYAPNMEFRIFDISQDGLAQGFEAASYDLILAPNVVHVTAPLKETLSNLEPLLKPDGFIILTELCSLVKSPNYIFGNFPERWDVELKAAGFTGVDAVVPDQGVPSYRLAATIISQPARKADVPEIDRAVTLLCQSADADIVKRLQLYLRDGGRQVERCRLGEEMPPKGRDIIASVGLDSDFFSEDLSPDWLAAVQALIRHVDAEKVLWLCPPFQVRCNDPRSAQTLSVA